MQFKINQSIQKSYHVNFLDRKLNLRPLSNIYFEGGSKDFEVRLKIISLQCSCIRKLDNYHEWKIEPSYLTNKHCDKYFNFHEVFLSMLKKSNISRSSIVKYSWISSVYIYICTRWSSCILSNFWWCNKNILINSQSI